MNRPASSRPSLLGRGGASEDQQVGIVRLTANANSDRASLWSGTADSFVNLHPPAATWSVALRVENGQQVGFAKFGQDHFAAMWTGTPESYINMNPAGATRSEIFDVHQGYQVGAARFNSSFDSAALWMGSPESYIDLSLALDATWTASAASSVWIDGTTLNIGGWGTNSVSGNREALLWTMEIPGAGPCNPADLAEPFNQLNFFDVSEFLALFSYSMSVVSAVRSCSSRPSVV